MVSLKRIYQALKSKPLLAVASMNFAVALVKLSLYFSTGSLLILASALDSVFDSLTSSFNAVMSRFAQQDADRKHPFGHGGFQVIAALLQSLLITTTALFIFWESIGRFLGQQALNTKHLPIAFAVFILATIFSSLSAWYLDRQQQDKEHKDLIIEADKAHYASDVWLNVTSILGLALVLWTQWAWLDAIFGLLGALIVIRIAIPFIAASFASITQEELSAEVQQQIVDIILATDKHIKGVHRLRSRAVGSDWFVDFHLSLPRNMTLKDAHKIADNVEQALNKALPHMDVLIHLDPDDHDDEFDWQPSYLDNEEIDKA